MERFKIGDIVKHFKRENVSKDTAEYLYKISAFASHTENGEKLVIYQALYPPYKTYARPYDMFISIIYTTSIMTTNKIYGKVRYRIREAVTNYRERK